MKNADLAGPSANREQPRCPRVRDDGLVPEPERDLDEYVTRVANGASERAPGR